MRAHIHALGRIQIHYYCVWAVQNSTHLKTMKPLSVTSFSWTYTTFLPMPLSLKMLILWSSKRKHCYVILWHPHACYISKDNNIYSANQKQITEAYRSIKFVSVSNTSDIILALCNNIKFRFYCYIFCTQLAQFMLWGLKLYTFITYSMSVLYFSITNKAKRMALLVNFKLSQYSTALGTGHITIHLTWNYHYHIWLNNYLHLNTKQCINVN
jgi:hypothetical protein